MFAKSNTPAMAECINPVRTIRENHIIVVLQNINSPPIIHFAKLSENAGSFGTNHL